MTDVYQFVGSYLYCDSFWFCNQCTSPSGKEKIFKDDTERAWVNVD